MNEAIAGFFLLFLVCGFILFVWIVKLIIALVRFLESKTKDD